MRTRNLSPVLQHFDPGAVIYHQGEYGGPAYVVQTGTVALDLRSHLRTVRLAVLGCKSLFGEVCALDGGKRTATATAITPTDLCVIPREAVQQKVAESVPFVRAMIAVLVKNLRNSDRIFLIENASSDDIAAIIGSLCQDLHRRVLNDAASASELEHLAQHLDLLDHAVQSVTMVIKQCQLPSVGN